MPSLFPDTHGLLSRSTILSVLAAASILVPSGTGLAAILAALPTQPTTFDATYAAPTGHTVNVPAGGNLQAVLNSAQPGDTIVVQAGVTYTGPFTLPNKTTGTGWIYIVSSAYASLPAIGQRVVPTDAANMPKIVAAASSTTMVTVANSHKFRFVGIEFAPISGAFVYTLVTIGNADASPATLPSDIVFDRCYVHGDPTHGGRRGIEMDGVRIAVVDSYISGFKEIGADTQGLWAYNTTGPLKIVNNYIEAAAENIVFGGSDSLAATLIPSDIEIRNNYFFKPLAWISQGWVIKNLLEFKAAKRVLVSGNKFENSPASGQSGHALLVTPRNQDGGAPWSITADITIVDNVFINVGGAFNILGTDNLHPSQTTARVLIRNNILGVTSLNGALGRAFQVVGGGTDITIDHNTIIDSAVSGSSTILMADSLPAKTDKFVFTNNITTKTGYGFFGAGLGTGTAALNGEFANWTFSNNALVGETSSSYPSGNFFPADVTTVKFANYAGGDYSLTASSPYKNASTDGTDLGANLSVVTVPSNPTPAAAVPNPPTDLAVH